LFERRSARVGEVLLQAKRRLTGEGERAAQDT
jgi:hypothetical protein